MKRLRDEVAKPIVTNPQVQDQPAIDAPVVLSKEAKVDEAPRVVGPAGVEADAARRVVHDIRESLISHVPCIRVGVSSRRQIQRAAEFECVSPAHVTHVLFRHVGGMPAAHMAFPAHGGQARI